MEKPSAVPAVPGGKDPVLPIPEVTAALVVFLDVRVRTRVSGSTTPTSQTTRTEADAPGDESQCVWKSGVRRICEKNAFKGVE